MTGRHDTVGADLVNHCVNDILVQGAEPLFFLDYLATGRLSPEVAEQVVGGVARGCRENGCALHRRRDRGDAGLLRRRRIRHRRLHRRRRRAVAGDRRAAIVPGDVLIGLPSAGLHTNGYSLARRVLFESAGWTADTVVPELGATVGDALLAPHRSYLPAGAAAARSARLVKGLAHITGGGITENLPRVLPEGCAPRSTCARGACRRSFSCCRSAAQIPARRDVSRVQHGSWSDPRVCAARCRARHRHSRSQTASRMRSGSGSVVAGDRRRC